MGVEGAGRPQLPKSTSKSGVRFVYFDVNGCLVRFFHQAFTKLAHETGESPDRIEAVIWHNNDQVCRGTMSVHEFNAILAKQLKLPSIDWQKYYLDAVEPIEQTHELVEWVSRQYYVGLLTNIMPGFVDAMKARRLVPHVFYDAIVDSSQIGAIKPERKIYEVAAERSGVKPEEILLVDDSRTNLMAAEHLGWHVLWFDDYRPKSSVARIRKALELAD
jgi:FMN phosphatase YigB (HAD superfamily)